MPKARFGPHEPLGVNFVIFSIELIETCGDEFSKINCLILCKMSICTSFVFEEIWKKNLDFPWHVIVWHYVIHSNF